jgi:hypothetical protein
MGLVAFQSLSKIKIDSNFWMMANVLQFIRVLCLLPPPIPTNVKDYLLSKFEIFNFHISQQIIEAPYKEEISDNVDSNFEEYGVHTTSILVYIYADIV